MRVYIPATLARVADLLASGSLAAPVDAFAVTRALRSWAEDSGPCDTEELELVALSEAARAALRMLADTAQLAPLRVVLAVDAPDHLVRVDDESDLSGPGTVNVTEAVPLAWVRAAHVDEPEAGPEVRTAAAAVLAADAGEADAEALVAVLQTRELLWYAPGELSGLVHQTG